MPEQDYQPTSPAPDAAAHATSDAPGPLKVWLLAIRPKTLPAAAASVIVGTALAFYNGVFSAGPALAALAIALLLQIGSNLANDVYDDERGADTADRLGPLRVTQSGLLSRKQVKAGMKTVLFTALGIGFYLTWVRGPMVLVIGVAAIVAAVAYTGGPWPLGYHGLGEVFVFLFFGVTAVVGTYWVQSGTTTPAAWLMSVPVGLLITAIIVVNNLRDVEQDRVAGKRTVAVRVGVRYTRVEYALCVAGAYACVIAGVAFRLLPSLALLSLISAPMGFVTWRIVATQAGTPLNRALALTGQTALLFSIFFALGMVLA